MFTYVYISDVVFSRHFSHRSWGFLATNCETRLISIHRAVSNGSTSRKFTSTLGDSFQTLQVLLKMKVFVHRQNMFFTMLMIVIIFEGHEHGHIVESRSFSMILFPRVMRTLELSWIFPTFHQACILRYFSLWFRSSLFRSFLRLYNHSLFSYIP
jgi:hypothetical protein